MSIKVKDPVICYATAQDHLHYVAPPREYIDRLKNTAARTTSTTIEVSYVGFENVPQAQQAFQQAVDIWAALLNTPMPIRIEARWTTLGANVLGSANYTYAYANFEGAQKLNVFYPVAIAEKITGREMNGGDIDIFANFNSSFTWHFDPTTTPPAGTYDLTTVVLHEIGHGLGFSGTLRVSGTQGLFGLSTTTAPIIYDIPIENIAGSNLIETFDSPSANMAAMLTSGNLFFDAPSGRTKLYAPTTYSSGSSISHVDETTYNGTKDALMTPQIAAREQLNHPGIALQMLGDIGWETIKIKHNKLPGTENIAGPYTVTAKIEADSGYNASTVTLHYTTDGSTFIPVPMAPSGPADTFTGNIPGSGVARDYGYYISVENEDGVEYVNPGKFVRAKNTQLQHFFIFKTGPDTSAPIITHTKKPFLLDTETELVITAEISDNTGSLDAVLQYTINDVPQADKILTLTVPETDSVYTVTLDITALANGDVIKYRIAATDHAANPNTAYSPSSSTYHILNVVGLEPTQDSYANDFELPDRDLDFFGTGFTVEQPTGFNNRAIHSGHPYPEGNGLPNNELNLIYQLRYPIRVQASDATLKFDEIVLIEPGETGSVFGGNGFYDYVVVEGSLDGGQTWRPIAPGYDCRNQSAWLARWNAGADANGNSSAAGIPSLYITRTINMLQTFAEGDEVVIRFRLYSDQLATGWGWSIDNLKIQIDDTPPLILHDHIDYLLAGEDVLIANSKVSDAGGIEEYSFQFFINGEEPDTIEFDVEPLASQYNFSLTGLAALSAGDVVYYRFEAKDKNGNISTFPPAGFMQVPIVNFVPSVAQYSNNFNTASTDFVGNFFSISQPAEFADGAIHSTHFYPTGMGLDKTSNFTFTLKKPILVSANNPYIRFDEIALVEGHANGVVFGTEAFKDYVIVEGSKNNGQTWIPFVDGYDIVGTSAWTAAFNSNANGTPGLFRTRTINMKESGDFITGDNVLVRFRLFSNETITGWGWAIDNLYIQDPITGIETQPESAVNVYPNPAHEKIAIEADMQTSGEFSIQLFTPQGQKLYHAAEPAVNSKITHTIDIGHLPSGMYLVKISSNGKSVVKKVLKTN